MTNARMNSGSRGAKGLLTVSARLTRRILIATMTLIAPGAFAAETAAPARTATEPEKGSPVSAWYDKGLWIKTDDDRFGARIRWRVQMRGTDVSSADLLGEEDGVEEAAGFRIRRARFKLDGHVYEKWLKYYLEYGIAGNSMLTWQFDVAKMEKLSFRVGQYKVLYNRERVDSSGKQQFVDRSVVNNPFTVEAWLYPGTDKTMVIARSVTATLQRTAFELGIQDLVPYVRFETSVSRLTGTP